MKRSCEVVVDFGNEIEMRALYTRQRDCLRFGEPAQILGKEAARGAYGFAMRHSVADTLWGGGGIRVAKELSKMDGRNAQGPKDRPGLRD